MKRISINCSMQRETLDCKHEYDAENENTLKSASHDCDDDVLYVGCRRGHVFKVTQKNISTWRL